MGFATDTSRISPAVMHELNFVSPMILSCTSSRLICIIIIINSSSSAQFALLIKTILDVAYRISSYSFAYLIKAFNFFFYYDYFVASRKEIQVYLRLFKTLEFEKSIFIILLAALLLKIQFGKFNPWIFNIEIQVICIMITARASSSSSRLFGTKTMMHESRDTAIQSLSLTEHGIDHFLGRTAFVVVKYACF